ncbi:Sister chromatid cohesion protein 2 [Coemansia javaensis]|uniref:Sister chromatid cohesion protein n=1 Tax=Coemansia javaensis TaxID=2761396 RepID=A0A9W8HG88_9FUNG|nr:Sister chromatid cohesion protein 2 [Coemansia javaensis]
MRPIDVSAPADTRACLRYWPVLGAVSLDTSIQSQYEGATTTELALEDDLQRLSLVDGGLMQAGILGAVQEALLSDEVQRVVNDPAQDIERLDDFLTELFDEDDAADEGGSGASSMFQRVGEESGGLALTRHAVRRIRALLGQCPRSCLSKHISSERLGRLSDLLMAAVEAARSTGLASMVRDGAAVKRGTGLADGYCRQLGLAMAAACLGLDVAELALWAAESGRAQHASPMGKLLHAATAFLKDFLLDCLIPLLDTTGDSELADAVADGSRPLHWRLRALLEAALAANSAAAALAAQSFLREEDVVPLVYVSIGVMFCSGDSLRDKVDVNLLELIRRASQALLRGVFELHAGQRAWILEEVLASLARLPAQKRAQSASRTSGGRPVQLVSVLLLQLLQATARLPEDLTAGLEGGGLSAKEWRMLLQRHRKATAAAASSADFAIRYMIGRCAKREGRGATNEAEYRALLEAFVDDCIALLGHPQWPAAEMVVRIYSLHIMEILDEEKSAIVVRNMALEGAAQIASHIAQSLPARSDNSGGASGQRPDRLEPVTADSSAESIGRFRAATAVVLGYLQSRAAGGESTGAIPFHVGSWASMLIAALLKNNRRMSGGGDDSTDGADAMSQASDGSDSECDDDDGSNGDGNGDSDASKTDCLQRRMAIEECLREYAKIAHQSTKTMVGGALLASATEGARAVLLLQPLFQSFDMLLMRVALALGASQVALRSRALRSLNQIARHRPQVLYQPSVKQAINHRLRDSSPLVREAAIDLIGKHIAHNPELTGEYYGFISVRVLDKGPSVRRRVMRILADIYSTSEDMGQLVDIGTRLLQRTADDERSIREQAQKTLHELWFSFEQHSHAGEGEGEPAAETSGNVFNALPPEAQRDILRRVRVMTGVMDAARAHDAVELMAGLFRGALSGAAGPEAGEAQLVIRCVVDALFEQLLQAEESAATTGAAPTEFSVPACLCFIATLSGIAPDAVGARVESLCAYLRLGGAVEESTVLDALTAFSNTLLAIPHPSAAFLGALEGDLVALLSSSPQSILAVAVPCLCTLVARLTGNYAKLVRLFRSCVLQLYREQRAAGDSGGGARSAMSPKNLMRFIILAGLMSRYIDFDACRERSREHFKELDQIAGGDVLGLMSGLLLAFASAQQPVPVQLAAVQMLGQLHIRRPQLAVEPQARAVMDRAFAGGSAGHKLQVLRNFLEFLRADAEQHAAQERRDRDAEREVDARALVGNVGDVGGAGVGASLMQTYLDRILDAIFASSAPALRAAGFRVVSLVLEQGLAHPLKCMPALIALGTSSDPHIRAKALRLHQEMCFKYASFIHSRDLEGVRKAYEYQLLVRGSAEAVEGYDSNADTQDRPDRPAASLQFVYSQVRSRRVRRNELLALLVKVCDSDPNSTVGAGPAGADVHFVRFVAENLSALEYKYLDEVLHVIYQASAVIASTGVGLYHQFEAEAEAEAADGPQWRRATEESVCISILFVLREFLKAHYGLSESRCAAYSTSDPAGARDKAAVWHAQGGRGRIEWGECPSAVRRMETAADHSDQRARFRRMMAASLTGSGDPVEGGGDSAEDGGDSAEDGGDPVDGGDPADTGDPVDSGRSPADPLGNDALPQAAD